MNLFLVIAALFAVSLAGCLGDVTQSEDDGTDDGSMQSESDGTGSSSGTGSDDELASVSASTGYLTTYIKDAPTEYFSEIWVTVDRVTVHLAPGSATDSSDADDPDDNDTTDNGNETSGNETSGNETSGNETSGNETSGNETTDNGNGAGPSQSGGGWIVVVDEPRTLDLMSFSQNDSKAFLGESELEAGRYTQIRLSLSEAWGIRAEDGERENITLRNDQAMIVRSFQIQPDLTTQLVIDVDLDHSIKHQGPQNGPGAGSPGAGQGPGGPPQAPGGGSQGWFMIPVIGHAYVNEGLEGDPKEDVAGNGD